MFCIYCGAPSRVINSRHNRSQQHVWRRRQCQSCGNVFTTYEMPDRSKSWQLVKNGGPEDFNRDKLFVSLWQSCAHRPTALQDASDLTVTVIKKLLSPKATGLTPARLAQTALAVLKHFDSAAASHYAAFHKDVLKKT